MAGKKQTTFVVRMADIAPSALRITAASAEEAARLFADRMVGQGAYPTCVEVKRTSEPFFRRFRVCVTRSVSVRVVPD